MSFSLLPEKLSWKAAYLSQILFWHKNVLIFWNFTNIKTPVIPLSHQMKHKKKLPKRHRKPLSGSIL